MYNHIFFVRWVKKRLPFGLKILLIRLMVFIQKIIYLKLHLKRKEYPRTNKIFILLSTDYSNLGDHAMTYAQIKFLREHYPTHEIIEVLVGDTMSSLYGIKASLSEHDLITLKGGGNIGVEYFREELIRRVIIEYINNCKIVMFPQTVYFPNNDFGCKEFMNTMSVFNGNPQFYSFLRDKVSFNMIKDALKKKFLTPDIVFSLKNIRVATEVRNGALTCLRSDVEGIYNENDKKMILNVLKSFFNEVHQTDTIRDYKIEVREREGELLSIWREISACEVLITDRLHGMIFAAILGTPCVVLNTYNHKLRAQYEWINDLNYIKCIDLNKISLSSAVQELMKVEVVPLDTTRFDRYFSQIIEVMNDY